MDVSGSAISGIGGVLVRALDLAKDLYRDFDEKRKIELKEAFQEYELKTKLHYSRVKTFFSDDAPVELKDCYVPTRLSQRGREMSPSIDSCLQLSHRLVVQGTAGCGKSMLFRYLFLDCLGRGGFIPVLIEFRDLNSSMRTLREQIDFVLENHGFNVSGGFVEKTMASGLFCFLFDGFDELEYSKREAISNEIESLSSRYVNCPVFISSRPDEMLSSRSEYINLSICPLDLPEAKLLIGKMIVEEGVKQKFLVALESGEFEGNRSFLSNPLLLSIMMLSYGYSAEVPQKLSLFYRQAYEALFYRHDAKKGGYVRVKKSGLDISEFSRVFSLFSMQTYLEKLVTMSLSECYGYIERSKKAVPKDFEAGDYLYDLKRSVCLLVDDGIEVSFAHRTFQEYFAALYICSAPAKMKGAVLDRCWRLFSADNVISLLYEIDPGLVERELIVPQLRRLFEEIGAEDGVTDLAFYKYVTNAYSMMRLDGQGVSWGYRGDGRTPYNFVGFAMTLTDSWKTKDKNFYSDLEVKIRRALGCGGEYFMPLDKLEFDSPVFSVVSGSGSDISLAYLNAAYELCKRLQDAHKYYDEELLGALAAVKY